MEKNVDYNASSSWFATNVRAASKDLHARRLHF